jgi:hypothetical protein
MSRVCSLHEEMLNDFETLIAKPNAKRNWEDLVVDRRVI